MLKQRVRDHIQPSRDLGHSDKHGKQGAKGAASGDGQPAPQQDAQDEQGTQDKQDIAVGTVLAAHVKRNPDGTVCEDCS